MRIDYVLRECPFCGSKVKIKPKEISENAWTYFVICTCGASLKVQGIRPDRAVRETIRKWNKRI